MALSKVNAVRQKISVTLTVAFLDLKLTVYPKVKELRLRVKRSVRALREELRSLTRKLQKFVKWKLAGQSPSRSVRSVEKPSREQPLPGDVDA